MTDINNILQIIETARNDRVVSNEQARAISTILKMEGDDQVLVNRLISQGSDPFALSYVIEGSVPDHIRTAHYQGPGDLDGKNKDNWLFLAHHSANEAAAETTSLRDRVLQFAYAICDIEEVTEERGEAAIFIEAGKINRLPYEERDLSGVTVRVYKDSLGFAAAYWNGCNIAAVEDNKGQIFVGTPAHTTLEEQGVTVEKVLSSSFGIINPQ